MKIATGLDEPLSCTNYGLTKFSNPRYGLSVIPEQIFSHDLSEVWHCSLAETTRRWREFENDPSFKNLQPYAGSIEAIDYLKRMGNELFVITGREIFLKEITNEWIEKYYPNKFSGVFFARHPYVKTEGKTKAQICSELKVDLYIDDDDSSAKSCAVVVENVLLYDHLWNQNALLPRNIHRVYSWQEIVDFVRKT